MTEEQKKLIKRMGSVGTKITVVDVNEVRETFPNMFLPRNRWYKDDELEGWIMFVGENSCYGFDSLDWFEDMNHAYEIQQSDILATQEEIEQALLKEAKRRYDSKEVLYLGYKNADSEELDFNSYNYTEETNKFFVGVKSGNLYLVFDNGVWADSIEKKKPEEITMSELHKRLGYEVKIIK